MGKTLLLTGRPGVGKTTVIRRVAEELGDEAGGFYTEEIRDQNGRRAGFRLVTLTGETAVMAHVELHGEGRPQVSRYGVDVGAIEDVGLTALRRAIATDKVVIVDEIGRMELFSDAFKEAVKTATDGHSVVVGTVMRGRHPWVDKLKSRPEVAVWEVTVDNRDRLPKRVHKWLTR